MHIPAAWADWGSVENRVGRSSGCRFSVRMNAAGGAGGGVKEAADQKAVCPSCYAPVPGSTAVCPACGDLVLLGGTKVRATHLPPSKTFGRVDLAGLNGGVAGCLSPVRCSQRWYRFIHIFGTHG